MQARLLLAFIVASGTTGSLRIYLGAAPGFGKTVAMLDDGHRRKDRGLDVVIGIVETHGSKQIESRIGDLELVPRRRIEYGGIILDDMDVQAIIDRRPDTVLVDELAHTNVPGSINENQYQDVRELVVVGITVISTLNIQHLESLNDTIQRFTGVSVRETVPDGIMAEADKFELIDLAPDALIQRMKQGDIYPKIEAERASRNFFIPENLIALRDLALRMTARGVEETLDGYTGSTGGDRLAAVVEHIMVAVDHRPSGKALVRCGF